MSESRRSSAILPAVMIAGGIAAAPVAALANVSADIGTGALPAVMTKLPAGFELPENLANYERQKTEESEMAMNILDWIFGDEPVNRCGTTSGCRSGWDDSDCF